MLGCTESEAAVLLRGRGEVQDHRAVPLPWWAHLRDPHSYWLTTSQAARVLHVAPSVVRRMLEQAYVVHTSSIRLMRRREIVERAQQGPAAALAGRSAGL